MYFNGSQSSPLILLLLISSHGGFLTNAMHQGVGALLHFAGAKNYAMHHHRELIHYIHTGKCIRRFGGIYAYCWHFIDRKWLILVLVLYRKTCHMPYKEHK